MVTSSHSVTTEKRVKVGELKAQLSAYIHAVWRGSTVTICDRETPVARLVPYRTQKEALAVRKPTRSLANVTLAPAPSGAVDSHAVLRALRQQDR